MWFLLSFSAARDAVELRHLDVHDHEIGAQFGGQLNGRLTVSRLADDVEAVVAEDLDDVETDERLVLRDHDSSGRGCRRPMACSCSVTLESYGMVVRGSAGAGVAEWQTRSTQNALSERACGFESHHRYETRADPARGRPSSSCEWWSPRSPTWAGPRGPRLRPPRSGERRGRRDESHHRYEAEGRSARDRPSSFSQASAYAPRVDLVQTRRGRRSARPMPPPPAPRRRRPTAAPAATAARRRRGPHSTMSDHGAP